MKHELLFITVLQMASTRAIILDVVHNYHCSTFYNCIKRFIARRGCPSTVYHITVKHLLVKTHKHLFQVTSSIGNLT